MEIIKSDFDILNEKISEILKSEIPANENEAAIYMHMKIDSAECAYIKYCTPENIGRLLYQIACSDIIFASELIQAANSFQAYYNSKNQITN